MGSCRRFLCTPSFRCLKKTEPTSTQLSIAAAPTETYGLDLGNCYLNSCELPSAAMVHLGTQQQAALGDLCQRWIGCSSRGVQQGIRKGEACRPSLLGWRPSLVGWRRPSLEVLSLKLSCSGVSGKVPVFVWTSQWLLEDSTVCQHKRRHLKAPIRLNRRLIQFAWPQQAGWCSGHFKALLCTPGGQFADQESRRRPGELRLFHSECEAQYYSLELFFCARESGSTRPWKSDVMWSHGVVRVLFPPGEWMVFAFTDGSNSDCRDVAKWGNSNMGTSANQI